MGASFVCCLVNRFPEEMGSILRYEFILIQENSAVFVVKAIEIMDKNMCILTHLSSLRVYLFP